MMPYLSYDEREKLLKIEEYAIEDYKNLAIYY